MIAPQTLLQNRYLVLEQIKKGGMGAVYKATDQRFGSTVALKETFFDKPQLLKAFEREARLLNHLRHPALPRVSDHFTEEDGQFLVMEFIPGDDLSDTLKERGVPFPRSSVLEWADQLLDALDYLHTHEPPIVHRDIKPQNLKLTTRGHIVLLDFGLAKGTPMQAADMTATASLFGYSFNYAPLEQMQGTGTDPRSDLYSLGATLYHLLTNVTPPDALTRATAVLNGQPDPLRPANEIQAQVTGPVARVLMNAMAQSAEQRPPTAALMREALREAGKRVRSIASLPAVVPPASQQQSTEQNKLSGTLAATRAAGTAEVKQAGTGGSSHQAETVIQPASQTSGPSPFTARHSDNASVVTQVRAYQSAAPPGRRPSRALGIVMSIVLLGVVAAVVYTFTRQSSPPSPSVQAVPSPVETVAPSPIETPPPQQSGNPPSSVPRSQPVAVSADPQPEAAGNNPPAVQPTPQNSPAQPAATPQAVTPEEERARRADEIRRERREREAEDIRRRREAMEQEQRERERMDMERERDMRRREPPPPHGGPPPPPRREGPPPHQ